MGHVKDRRRLLRQDEAVDAKIARGLFPVVDLDAADEEGAARSGAVFGFMLVPVPGADKTRTVVRHGVEPLHVGKPEVVDETDAAAVVDGGLPPN